jgi:hypothetical protein
MSDGGAVTVAPPLVERGNVGIFSPGTWWTSLDHEETPELRWPLSVWVFDRMRRTDSQVASVLRAVTLPIRRTGWRVDPNGARPEVAQQIAEDLGLPLASDTGDVPPTGRAKDRFSWHQHLEWALLMLPFGFMFFEQVVRVDGGGMVRLRKLGPRMPRTIVGIDVADDGGLVSVTQAAGAKSVVIPVDRLVAYVHQREGGNWLGSSILRPAYKFWILKDRLLRVQAQTIERNGMGVPLYEGAEGEEDLTAGLSIAQRWRAGDNSGAAIPNTAKLTLKGVDGHILPDADPVIRYYDEQIARAVLAHFLNLGTQTGSWALGTTFADFFTLSLEALADQIADVATQHVVEDLVDWNWGPDEPAPRIIHDEIGAKNEALVAAIKMLVDAGVIIPDRITEEFSRALLGLPAKGLPSPTPQQAPAGGG